MGRDWQITGECMTLVRFGDHFPSNISNILDLSSPPTTNLCELGLASEGVTITPRYIHKDINITDFGPEIPTEVMWMLADVTVRQRLIHFDPDVLDICLSEAMGGGGTFRYGVTTESLDGRNTATAMPPAGTLLGNGLPLLASGNHFISLNLSTVSPTLPWHFPAAYLIGQPVVVPLGTEKQMVDVTWRCIPYVPILPGGYNGYTSGTKIEQLSSGSFLWDRDLDSPNE